jgi:pre-mRNA cleavage complex 2 protein Pcf11
MDTRPVFSPDLVRPIENALMKAKAAMMPQAQLPGRPRSALPPHRDTPTPPGIRSAGGTPSNFPPQAYPFPHGAQPPNGHYPPHPQVSTILPLPEYEPDCSHTRTRSPIFKTPARQPPLSSPRCPEHMGCQWFPRPPSSRLE